MELRKELRRMSAEDQEFFLYIARACEARLRANACRESVEVLLGVLSTKVERPFIEYAMDNGSEGRISRLPGLFADRRMNLRCPDCGGRDLRKVSFAYE